jgi:hypothetical protein
MVLFGSPACLGKKIDYFGFEGRDVSVNVSYLPVLFPRRAPIEYCVRIIATSLTLHLCGDRPLFRFRQSLNPALFQTAVVNSIIKASQFEMAVERNGPPFTQAIKFLLPIFGNYIFDSLARFR